MSDVIHLRDTDARDAYADLLKGASERLSAASWRARQACEAITHENGTGADDRIDEAQRALSDARRHAAAAAAYRREYDRAISNITIATAGNA